MPQQVFLTNIILPGGKQLRSDELFRQPGVKMSMDDIFGNAPQWRQFRRDLATNIEDKLRTAARGGLLTGMTYPFRSRRFEEAIGPPVLIKDGLQIHMVGDLATLRYIDMLTQGHPRIDLKPGLLRGGKTSKTTGRRFRVVPFTKSAEAAHEFESIPQRFASMLYAGNYIRKKQRTAVQPAFKPMTVGERTPYGPGRPHMVWGRKKSPAGYRQKFGHLSRLSSTKNSGYMVFRTVTDDPSVTPQNSWIIIARPANPIFQAAIDAAIAEL